MVPEAHLLNTPPLHADALARTHTLVPGNLLNMPPLLSSTHARPSTPWCPADSNTPPLCADVPFVEHAASLDVDMLARAQAFCLATRQHVEHAAAFSLQAILAAGQSWPQALRGASCAGPGTLVWCFYMHPVLGAMLALFLFLKSSVNSLFLWCSSAQLHLFSCH